MPKYTEISDTHASSPGRLRRSHFWSGPPLDEFTGHILSIYQLGLRLFLTSLPHAFLDQSVVRIERRSNGSHHLLRLHAALLETARFGNIFAIIGVHIEATFSCPTANSRVSHCLHRQLSPQAYPQIISDCCSEELYPPFSRQPEADSNTVPEFHQPRFGVVPTYP